MVNQVPRANGKNGKAGGALNLRARGGNGKTARCAKMASGEARGSENLSIYRYQWGDIRNLPTSQSGYQSSNVSIFQSINLSVCHTICQSINISIYRRIKVSIDQCMDILIKLSTHQCIAKTI